MHRKKDHNVPEMNSFDPSLETDFSHLGGNNFLVSAIAILKDEKRALANENQQLRKQVAGLLAMQKTKQ